jgi:hypothetical protein
MLERRDLPRWVVATLLPWLVAGVAAVCTLGELTVSSVERPHRLGLLPSPWAAGVVVAGSILAAATLRRSGTSWAPLLLCALALVQWLPVPVPAVALALAGPLHWGLWAAAGGLLVAGALSRSCWTPPAWLSSPRRAPVTAALLAVVVLAGVRAGVGSRSPTGDEPHYLLLTQSLLLDHDLDVQNNYDRRDHASYYAGDLEPHWYVRGLRDRGILYHLPGLPALIAPAFALGGMTAVAGVLVLLVAGGTALVWRYAYVLTGDAASAWFGWATATLTFPLVAQAGMVYPDAPASVVVAALMLALASDERTRHERRAGQRTDQGWSRPITVLLGIGCAALPWLHTRLAVPAVLGALCLLVRMRAWRRARSHGTIFAGLILAGIGSWLYYFKLSYGVWDPRAPYGLQTPFALSAAFAGAVAMLMDQQAGLLPNAPVYVLALYAMWLLARRLPRLAVEYAIVAVPYLALNAGFHMWWGGASVPGRLMLAVLLPFAAGSALVWRSRSQAGRLASVALLTLSVLAAGSRVWGGGEALLFPDGARRNQWLDWLSPVVDLTPGLPDYFSSPGTLVFDALVWVAAIAASMRAGRWMANRLTLPDTTRATVYVAAVCVGMCGAIEVLWTRAPRAAIAPTGSQLNVIAQLRDHGERRVLDVSRAAWLSGGDALARLEIGSDRPAPRSEALSLQVQGVPPGRYLVETAREGHDLRRLSLWIGRSDAALEEWPLGRAGGMRTRELLLPAGAATLVVRAEPAAPVPAPRVVLRPLGLFSPPGNAIDARELARRAASYGDLDVFAFGDDVWLEPHGVWIGGARAGRLVLSVPGGRSSVPLLIRAGPPGARVQVDGPGLVQSRLLGPLESMAVDVPVAARSRMTWITVRTDRGFRPSEVDPGSRDRRLLGCSLSFR